jgi:WD40 repeat protein
VGDQLVRACLSGYNATLLAYGQTGAGKSYTMGSASLATEGSQLGILPRAIFNLFDGLSKKTNVRAGVRVSFLEIYNEELIDLLDYSVTNKASRGPGERQSGGITIREEKDKILLIGLKEEKVGNATEALQALEKGTLRRSTSSTLMNETSSRSHAIFTITVEQRPVSQKKAAENGSEEVEPQEETAGSYIESKFHLVDLAGSEKIKKTGATGQKMKEGININMGLFTLGNVISALTDDSGRPHVHVPYRDSKLTRILQDSLGGNSQTVMIACVSPASSNYYETVSTLNYASRAQKIKNKPVVNHDPVTALINSLRGQLMASQKELKNIKRLLIQHSIKYESPSDPLEKDQASDEADDPFNSERPHKVKELEEKLKETERRLDAAEKGLRMTQIKEGDLREKCNRLELEAITLKKERDEAFLRSEAVIGAAEQLPGGLAILENISRKMEIPSLPLVEELRAECQHLQSELECSNARYDQVQRDYEEIQADWAKFEKLQEEKAKVIETLKMELREEKSRREKQALRALGERLTSRVSKTPAELFKEIADMEEQRKSQEVLSQDPEYSKETEEMERRERELIENQRTAVRTHVACNQGLDQVSELWRATERDVEQLRTEWETEFKKEYFKKVQELKKEKEAMKKEMGEKRLMSKQYAELKAQLQEYKAKESQVNALKKMLDDRNSRIQSYLKSIKDYKESIKVMEKKKREADFALHDFKMQKNREMRALEKKLHEQNCKISRFETANLLKSVPQVTARQSVSKAFFGLFSIGKSKKPKTSSGPQDFEDLTMSSLAALSPEEFPSYVEFLFRKMETKGRLEIQYDQEVAKIKEAEKELNQAQKELSRMVSKIDFAEKGIKRKKKNAIDLEGSDRDRQESQEMEQKSMEIEQKRAKVDQKQRDIESMRDSVRFLLKKTQELMGGIEETAKCFRVIDMLKNDKNIPKFFIPVVARKLEELAKERARNREEERELRSEAEQLKRALNEANENVVFLQRNFEIERRRLASEYETEKMGLFAMKSELSQSVCSDNERRQTRRMATRQNERENEGAAGILSPRKKTGPQQQQMIEEQPRAGPTRTNAVYDKKLESENTLLRNLVKKKETEITKMSAQLTFNHDENQKKKRKNQKDFFIGVERPGGQSAVGQKRGSETQEAIEPEVKLTATGPLNRNAIRDAKKKVKENSGTSETFRATTENALLEIQANLSSQNHQKKEEKREKVSSVAMSAVELEGEDFSTVKNRHWKMQGSYDVCSSAVRAVCSFQDRIFVGHGNSISAINLEKGSSSASLSGGSASFPKSHLVRAVIVDPVQRWLIGASDNTVKIWSTEDLSSPVASLSTAVKSIRAMAIIGNTLFCGGLGKGETHQPGLQAWDMRTQKYFNFDNSFHFWASRPLMEGEKNQGILSFGVKDNWLFYGGMSREVKVLCSKDGMVTDSCALKPPHNDSVQALCVMRNSIVSCAHRQIVLWGVKGAECDMLEVNGKTHKDTILSLESNKNGTLCYSGAKDGIIRVWEHDEERKRLACLSEITDNIVSLSTLHYLDFWVVVC